MHVASDTNIAANLFDRKLDDGNRRFRHGLLTPVHVSWPKTLEEYPHIYDLFLAFSLERIHFIEKSRDLMVTWACVAYLTCRTMTVAAREVLMQTQKAEKVKQLIKYAKCLYRTQPQWLQDAYPLSKPIDSQADNALVFAHGGAIIGIPGGANQIRSYHPWGYLNDESSFQPDAGECYNEALSAVSGKIIFNSSAGPGWFADVRHDVIRTDGGR